jgi:hypothetical protein
MPDTTKFVRGNPAGETLVAVGENFNLTLVINIPEGQTSTFTIRPSYNTPFGIDVRGYVFNAGSLSVSGGSFSPSDESFSFTTITNTPNGAVTIADRLNVTVLLQVNATARQWVSDNAQRLFITMQSSTATMPLWTSPSLRIAQSAQRTNFTFSPAPGDGNDVVTTTVYLRQPFIACGSSSSGSLTMTCEVGIMSDVVFASYGNAAGSCNLLTNTASFTTGSCNNGNSLSVFRTACVGKTSCTVATSAFSDPCSGTSKTLTAYALCAYPTTASYQTNVSIAVDRKFLNPRNYATASGVSAVFDAPSYSWILSTIPFMNYNDIYTFTFDATINATIETGDVLNDAAPPAYYSNPVSQIASTGPGVGAYPIRAPSISLVGTTSLIDTQLVGNREYLAPGESGSYVYTVQLWEGTTTNGIFSISINVPWINVTGASLTRFGANITPSTTPAVTTDNIIYTFDIYKDYVESQVGTRVMTAGSSSAWQFEVTLTFMTLDISGPTRGSAGSIVAAFTSLLTATTNTRAVTFAEPQIQSKVYCQGTSPINGGNIYAEYWIANENTNGPVIQRSETTSGFDYGSGSPATGFPTDNWTSRLRGSFCSPNGTVTVNNRQFRFTGDDAYRITIGGSRFDFWSPSIFNAAREIQYNLTTGTCVPFWLEQIETTGNAFSRVQWRQFATGSYVDIPVANMLPVAPVHTAENELDCEIHIWAIYTNYNFAGVFNVSLVHDLTSASLAQGAYINNTIGAPRAGSPIAVQTKLASGGPAMLVTTDYISSTNGDVLRIPFRSTLNNNAELGRMFTSVANVVFRSAPGAYARSYNLTVNPLTTPVIMVPFVNMSIVDSSNSETASDRYSTSIPDIAIGELVTVHVDVEFRPGQTTASSLVFTLPYATSPATRFSITNVQQVRAGADLQVTGTFSAALSNVSASIRDGNFDTATITIGTVYFNPSLWAASTFASRSLRYAVTFFPSNAAPTGFSISNRVFTPRAEFRSSLINPGPYGITSLEVVAPVLQVVKSVSGSVVAAGYPLTLQTITTHASGSQSPAYRVNLTDISSFLSSASSSLPAVFASRWVTPNMSLTASWTLGWTHVPIASELECGLSTFPAATAAWAADVVRASPASVNSNQPTIATPVARVTSLQYVKSPTDLSPVPSPRYTYQQSIYALATVTIPSARCSALIVRVTTPAGKVSLAGIETITPSNNVNTSLASWDSLKTAITGTGATGVFTIAAGNVIYGGPALNSTVTLLLRLTVTDPSCTLAGQIMNVLADVSSSLSGGYSPAANASFAISPPVTQISFNDYVVSKCQQWALLQPPVTGGSELSTLYTSIPQGWSLAGNTTDSIDVIKEMTASWASIVPSGGCILTFKNVSGTVTVVGYYPNGSPCPGPYTYQVSVNDSTCIGTAAKDRILLRGSSSANCDVQQNRFCQPQPAIRLVGNDPSTPAPGVNVFPSEYYVFAAPASPSLTLGLQLFFPSAPKLDILLVVDTNGLSANDISQLQAGSGTLHNLLTTPAYLNADSPTIGLATVSTTGRVYTQTIRSPLTTSPGELASAMTGVTSSAAGTANILGALGVLMQDTASIGWRDDAYKMVLVISDNDHFDDLTLNATSISTNIVSSFFSGNPTPLVASRYTGVSAGLPLGRYLSGPLTTTTILSNGRYNGWASNVAQLIKNTYYTISVVAGGDHSDATPFVRSLPAKLDLSAATVPASVTRNITVGWPAGLDPQIQSSYRALGQYMGFGATGIRLTANTRPDASAVTVVGNEDTDIPFTLAISDRDKNKLEVQFVSGPAYSLVQLLTSDTVPQIVAFNTWYQAVDFVLRPAADYFGSVSYTYMVSDRCANDTNIVSVTISNVNDPPAAQDFAFTLLEDETSASLQRITFTPYISDIDNPTAALTITIVDLPSPALGRLVTELGATIVAGNTPITPQTIRFVPNSNLNGVCQFTYVARDPAGATSAVATVTVTITAVNDAPVLSVPVNPVFGRRTRTSTTQDFQVLIADADAGDTVQLQVTALGSGVNNLLSHTVISTNPEKGVTISNTTSVPSNVFRFSQTIVTSNDPYVATLTWNMANIFNDVNTHTFTIRAIDRSGAVSNSVVVQLRISANRIPSAVEPQPVTLYEDDQLFSVYLTGYEEDYDDYATGIVLVINSLPSNGRLYASNDNAPLAVGSTVTIGNITSKDEVEQLTTYRVRYTPFANYNGPDNFKFQFRDASGGLSSAKTQPITVLPVNDPPTTVGFNVSTFQDTPIIIRGFSGSDIDAGDTLYLSISGGANGQLALEDTSILSSFPTNFTSNATSWSVVYTPPVFSCDDSKPFTSFPFRMCDGDNACSADALVFITVICVNHPPYGADKTVTALQETPLMITLDAADRDLFDPVSTLVVQITSTNLEGKGQLFKDAALTTPITLFEDIAFPHTVYFLGAENVYSENSIPVGNFQYQVRDVGTFVSRPRNTISVIIQRVNKPPNYLGNLDVYTDEDVPINFFFLAKSAVYDDGFKLGFGVRGYILASTHRGTLRVCDVNDTCSSVDATGGAQVGEYVNLPTPLELTNGQGRTIFLSDQYTWAENYTSLRMGLRDDEGLWANYTIRIHVRSVNNRPVITPLFPTGFDNPSLWEDTQYVLRWIVTDVDSAPSTLSTDINILLATRRLKWNLYSCSISNTTFDVNGCEHDAAVVATELGVQQDLPAFASASSSCNTVPGFPTTDFSNCFVEYRVLFKPDVNLFSYRYTQLLLLGRDDFNATSLPADAVMYVSLPTCTSIIFSYRSLYLNSSVRPVNDPPTIWAPTLIIANSGSGKVALRGADAAVDANPAPIGVDDIDAPQAVTLNLTIIVHDKNGIISFNGTACAQLDSATDNVYNCVENLRRLNNRLMTSEFVLDKQYMDADSESKITIIIDDLGWVGEDNLPHLNASTTISVTYSPPARLTIPPPSSNALFIASAVAAAAALILLGLLVWRLRKSFKVADEDYFRLGVSAISTAAINPLFKQQGKEGDNPLYKANNKIPE